MRLRIFLSLIVVFFSFAFMQETFAKSLGVTQQKVSAIADTGHNVQVWKIEKNYANTKKYKIQIMHALAGDIGSFYIIAWADTNNDDIPDKEIGRSKLKIAKKDGEWSSWEFSTKRKYNALFVGNTWSQSNEKVYYQSGGPNLYKGLSQTVFYSRSFNGTPNQSTGPRYTNIKVSLLEKNNESFGVTKQKVSNIVDTGHNLQVWKIEKKYAGAKSYKIRIKHAAAGQKGSFYIVAWADTNNDGIPDKEIGRSKLKTAKKNGAWSSWKFKVNPAYNAIFVGNTWNQTNEKVYYQSGGPNVYKGLSQTVFYSRSFNGTPNQSTGPRYTNIKVYALD